MAHDNLQTEACWAAVAARRKDQDGVFVYAVTTTGVYCRPSCASRQPRREHVRFFALPAAAEAAGFRPCKRCRPHETAPHDPQVALVQLLCAYMDTHLDAPERLSLNALAAHAHYAPRHLTAVFQRVLGLTPRQYVETRRMAALRGALQAGARVSDALYAVGYGSPSRLYERADAQLGMTPAQYGQGAPGIAIRSTVIPTPFGALLLAATERGVCAAGLYADAAAAQAALQREFSQAVHHDDPALVPVAEAILAHITRGAPLPELPLDIVATTFQARVWAALRQIPRGETRTYGQLAAALGQPTAARAVAAACADNRAALLIPCHRVIGADGALRGYKWGVERKTRLLETEAAPPAEIMG